MADELGFVYRTRLAWTRTAVSFLAAGLAATRLLTAGPASGVVWLVLELLLVVMTLSAVAGYADRATAEGTRTSALLLLQCFGLGALAILGIGGLLLN